MGNDDINVGTSVAGSFVFGSMYGAAQEAWKAGPQVKAGVVAQSFKINYAEVRPANALGVMTRSV